MNLLKYMPRTQKTRIWWFVLVLVGAVVEVTCLNGPHVCMVQQKYNITKRVKYRAPMAIRTYEWCLAMPPRCSKWNTEVRDLTRLETEERIAEVAVCCPGYKMKDVSCVPICPSGKTGVKCANDCPPKTWGPNCVNECKACEQGTCSPVTGECVCHDSWQGESCNKSMPSSTTTTLIERLLTTKTTTKTTAPTNTSVVETYRTTLTTSSTKPTTQMTVQNTADIPYEEVTTPLTVKVTKAVKNTTVSSLEIRTIKTTAGEANKHLVFKPPFNVTATKAETLQTIQATPIVNVKKDLDKNALNYTTSIPYIFGMTTPNKIETTKKTDATKVHLTTAKFKPKEIWIKPAQKGESLEYKVKQNYEVSHYMQKNDKKEIITAMTTPKTIIVSIIPTSVTYATYKKMFLTTASSVAQRNTLAMKIINSTSTEHNFNRTMVEPTTKPSLPLKEFSTLSSISTTVPSIAQYVSKSRISPIKSIVTNSMISTTKSAHNSPNTITTSSSFVPKSTTTKNSNNNTIKSITTLQQTENTKRNEEILTTQRTKPVRVTNISNRKLTSMPNSLVTTERMEHEEIFHILTEPEHITAVMGDKGTERSSVDLVSVLSIAGGVMMTVITVAIVIVMIERCKRPKYEDVRKFNEINMRVTIDNDNMPPPPYVRSIFHTPLPAPPTTEKCHYQPISTLDRNLKQFMRPVVVQAISPVMLENFRGILECHYDHLPPRDYNFEAMQSRCSVTPSMSECDDLSCKRALLAETAVRSMKCEATLDVIDNTTSEPLYAEIPCWRPPSEHAVEVMNLNGEAVTEL